MKFLIRKDYREFVIGDSKLLHFKNLLLIAGTGRNTGKTTLACEIINKFTHQVNITGVKISPHFHGGTKSLKVIYLSDRFNIYEEIDLLSTKDSSKMLVAGASRVYYLEVCDEDLQEAFNELIKYLPKDSAVVCESPALRKIINPGLFFIMDNINQQNKKDEILKWKSQADFFVETDKTDLKTILKKIQYSNGWARK